MAPPPTPPTKANKKNILIRWLPLVVLILGLASYFYFDLGSLFNFQSLKDNRETLLQWRKDHLLWTLLGFMGIYLLVVSFSIPGAVFFTLAGGFLLGPIWGTLCVVISATLGACMIFIAVQTSLGSWLKGKAAPWFSKMEKGFKENAFSYLLFVRLVPVFPFWVVNIVPALLNMRLKPFAIATFIGIIPGSFVYVLAGNGLGAILDQDKTPNLGIILEPPVLIPILCLAALSLIPIVYKKLKKA